jgi:D-alanyl-lipoteichoic acid acyltransferase DltB (MBOAT superfamily)
VAYALQLYFDFSGYSDMAVGLAKMFGVRFPLNFNSPFKAASMIDFWQRWHMTLTRYLTAYLYYPLAMRINRYRAARGKPVGRLAQRSPGGFAATVAVPTFYTMALAGIWHGAGVQYLVYGLLHAAFLTINHAYRAWRGSRALGTATAAARCGGGALAAHIRHAGNVLLTFVAALVAFAFFRAHSIHDAVALLQGMAGLRGFEALDWPSRRAAQAGFFEWLRLVAGRSMPAMQIAALLAIVWGMPNSHQLMGRFSPALERPAEALPAAAAWRPSWGWTVAMVCMLLFCVAQLHTEVRFLYFQF